MLALFAVYVGTARLGLTFDALAGVATTVWPPTGVAIAAICLGGRGRWPAIFLGGLRGQRGHGHPALDQRAHRDRQHRRGAAGARDPGAPALAARHGARARRVRAVGGRAGGDHGERQPGHASRSGWRASRINDGYGLFWMVWWVGDVLGALLIAPLIFVWARPWRPGSEPVRWLEGVVLAVLLTLVGLAVFHDLFPTQGRAAGARQLLDLAAADLGRGAVPPARRHAGVAAGVADRDLREPPPGTACSRAAPFTRRRRTSACFACSASWR